MAAPAPTRSVPRCSLSPLAALASGLLSLWLLPELPSLLLWGLSTLVSALLALRWRVFWLAFVALCGLGWGALAAHQALEARLDEPLDGLAFWVEGRVDSLPEHHGRSLSFELSAVESRHAGIPERIRVSWFDPPAQLPAAGESWRLVVRLKQPRGLVNPGGFDREAWLLARGIGATGTVKAGYRILPGRGWQHWRALIRQHLLQTDVPGAAGLVALVVGDGSGLDDSLWQTLQATGTVHLMVISGQHVGLLAGLLFCLVQGLFRWGCWPRDLPWLPSACVLAWLGSLIYAGLAGLDTPVVRACIMIGLVLLWRLRFREQSAWLPWWLALVLILLADPLSVLQPGLWLSFTVVAVLIFGFAGRLAWPWKLRVFWRAQWLCALGLIPVLLVWNLPLSLTGPLANLLAIPVVSLLVVPLALLGTLGLLLGLPGAEGLLFGAGWLLQGLFQILGALAEWIPAWHPPSLDVWSAALLGMGTLGWLLPKGFPLRPLAGLSLLAVLVLPHGVTPPAVGQARVLMLDVGQGLAVLVRTRSHALLYDAGPRLAGFDAGQQILLPALRALDVGALDLLMLSHADNDHAGGAAAVLEQWPVSQLSAGEPEELPAAWTARRCQARHWVWDEVVFSVWQRPGPVSGNAASCVLRVEASGERLLLTGDIDARTEQQWLAAQRPEAGLDWLVVAHHGSRTSTSAALLRQLRPRQALVSRSRHNPFGHPHREVVQRLQDFGVRILDTAESGALSIRLGAFAPAEAERFRQRHFWRMGLPEPLPGPRADP